ncbi:MAG: hypothetical protein ACXWIN_01010 [Burkholderiaceae bacterium]
MNFQLIQLKSDGVPAILAKHQSMPEAMYKAVKTSGGYVIAVRKKDNNAKLKFNLFDCADR